MKAGALRHRVDIEGPTTVQDSHGDTIATWSALWSDVPAAILPVSGREFFESQGIVGQVTAKIVIRWRSGVHPKMRIVHRPTQGSPTLLEPEYYEIVAVLPDPESGTTYLTLMCSREINEPEQDE